MNNKISPKFQMELIDKIGNVLWAKYNSYIKVKNYIIKWYECGKSSFEDWENFHIYTKHLFFQTNLKFVCTKNKYYFLYNL